MIGVGVLCLVGLVGGPITPVTSHYGTSAAGAALLPDATNTPGDVRPVTLKTVCAQRTGGVRNVSGVVKIGVYAAYGAQRVAGSCCEVDHLISLELGGSNDPLNLWPQPYLPAPGAHQKDALENHLHSLVCSGKVSLSAAQHEIATDWYAAFLKYGLKKGLPASARARLHPRVAP